MGPKNWFVINEFHCVSFQESTALIMSGGYNTEKVVMGASTTKTCFLKQFNDVEQKDRMWHTMNYDEANKVIYVCGGDTLTSSRCIKLDLKKTDACEIFMNWSQSYQTLLF